MSIKAEVRPSRGIALFVAGGILLLLALVGIVVYATGLPDNAADGSGLGLLRGVTVVGSAICGGVGALLLAIGGVKRVSASRRGLPDK